jgi:hypothetical protein
MKEGVLFSLVAATMAWLEEHPTSGHIKICFRWAGSTLKKTFKTTKRFNENLDPVERGRRATPGSLLSSADWKPRGSASFASRRRTCGRRGSISRLTAEGYRVADDVRTSGIGSETERGQEVTGVSCLDQDPLCSMFREWLPVPRAQLTAGRECRPFGRGRYRGHLGGSHWPCGARAKAMPVRYAEDRRPKSSYPPPCGGSATPMKANQGYDLVQVAQFTLKR